MDPSVSNKPSLFLCCFQACNRYRRGTEEGDGESGEGEGGAPLESKGGVAGQEVKWNPRTEKRRERPRCTVDSSFCPITPVYKRKR